jgi:lycopene beta-cyclase
VLTKTNLQIIDYLFAGGGASATLLLMQMEKDGLLLGKSIVIIDPDTKTVNDKTYCFWENANETLVHNCQHLISKQWQNVSVNQNTPEELLPMEYFHISSVDLYNELQKIISRNNITRVHEQVNTLESFEDTVYVGLDSGILNSKMVFDSRPPKFSLPKKNEAHLFQSFLGYLIELDTPIQDDSCVDLMDFEVNQLGFTQFVYVLPFGKNKMLVELTRFGEKVLNQIDAEPILQEYILKRFGDFKIMDIEKGCIPMSTAKIEPNLLEKVVPIGGKAGAIKPSTGYAFKNMFKHACEISSNLQNGMNPKTLPINLKHKFYDRLLLLILSKQPEKGKPIFKALFQKNKALEVMKFLDEKTTLSEDLKILSTLPFAPFLKSLGWHISFKLSKVLVPLLVLFFTIGLMVLNNNSPNLLPIIEPYLLLVGLFLVGIPHGALDYLLDSGNIKSKVSIPFILKYLGTAFIYLLIWLAIPNLALSFFLIFSAWHFGQGDMQQWQSKSNNQLKNIIWGLTILVILLFGHIDETNQILKNLDVNVLKLNSIQGNYICYVFVLIAFGWSILEKNIAMLISIITISICTQLPLLTSFGLYFIGQHSLNGWMHLKQGLNTNNKTLYMKALPFTLGAFLLFGILALVINNGSYSSLKEHLIPVFFIFISCISFPHVIAMNRFYKKYL